MKLPEIPSLFLTIFFYVISLVSLSLGGAFLVTWLPSLLKKERGINDARAMKKHKRFFGVKENTLWTRLVTRVTLWLWDSLT